MSRGIVSGALLDACTALFNIPIVTNAVARNLDLANRTLLAGAAPVAADALASACGAAAADTKTVTGTTTFHAP